VKAIRVLRKVKADEQWQLLPVAKTGERFDWNYVMLRGERLPAGAGAFYLEYREGGRKVRRLVGATPREVQAAMTSQAQVLELRDRGVEVEDAPEIHTRRPVEGKSIAEVVRSFEAHPPAKLRPKSIAKYNFDLEQFEAWARRQGITHLCQLNRETICSFLSYLVREEDLAMKSAVNKSVIVLKLVRDAGATIVMKKGDWPRVTSMRPEIYTPQQLAPLFAGTNRTEFALYQTFLMTGFRDQEIGYAARSDFNAADGLMSVTKKPGCSFDPKTYRERTVEIPPELVTILKDHVARMEEDQELLFPTSGGKRDKHMLRKLKRLALRQGLNCGKCESMHEGKPASCRTAPICRRWTLHKFRHTYATTLLRDGWDVVTVQHMLGHSKLESTLVYVQGLPSEERRRKMASGTLLRKLLFRRGNPARAIPGPPARDQASARAAGSPRGRRPLRPGTDRRGPAASWRGRPLRARYGTALRVRPRS